jgi:hypothetical protein
MKAMIHEDGAACSSGSLAGAGASQTATDINNYTPEKMRLLLDPGGVIKESLFERLEAADKRWNKPLTLQERVNSAEVRWNLKERSNITRIKIEEPKNPTDYEKELTKHTKAHIKAEADAFEKAQDSQQVKDAKLRDADYVDGAIDEFLAECL